MKSAILERPGFFNITEKKPGKLKKDEILVKVIFAGICGSDISSYFGKNLMISYPAKLGHELVGEVAEIGKNIKYLKRGDHVAAKPIINCGKCLYCKSGSSNLCTSLKGTDGAFSEYVIINEKMAFKIHKNSSLKEMVFAEPLAVATHAFKISRVKKNEKVLIIGAGTIGQMVLQVVKSSGVKYVGLSDIVESKLKVAKDTGADFVLKINGHLSIKTDIKDNCFDVIFDCVSNNSSITNAISLAGIKGRIIIVGQAHENLSLDVFSVMHKELNICGSFIYDNDDFIDAISLINKKKVNWANYISKTFDLSDIQNAFDEIIKNRNKYIKCLINPQ